MTAKTRCPQIKFLILLGIDRNSHNPATRRRSAPYSLGTYIPPPFHRGGGE